VIKHACLFLGKHHNATSTVGKSLEHVQLLLTFKPCLNARANA